MKTSAIAKIIKRPILKVGINVAANCLAPFGLRMVIGVFPLIPPGLPSKLHFEQNTKPASKFQASEKIISRDCLIHRKIFDFDRNNS